LRGVLAPLLSYEDALQAGLLADEGLLPNDDHDSNNEGYEGGAKEQATGAAKRLADAEVDEEAKSPRASQATELVRLAEARYRFGQTEDGRAFAEPRDGPRLALAVRGSLRSVLASAYCESTGRVAASSALTDALNVIEGKACAADRERVALRIASHDGGIVVDLGTPDGRAVVMTATGWTIVDRSPVLFRRTELTGTLPVPVNGGTLEELKAHVNVSDDEWQLLVGVLICWLLSDIPRPVVLLGGEQGTGKSTAARLLAALIDPSPAQLRAAPRDIEAWVLGASGSCVVVLDNLSSVSDWLSDAICRACTGEGLVRRTLYTDDGLTVTSFRRNVMLTSIDAGSLRGDLGDRLVTIELDLIDPADRKRDQVIAAAFTAAHARLLGALFELTSQVLAVLPRVSLTDPPRMADFAHVLAALDAVTGWSALDTYRAMAETIAAQVVEGDSVAQALAEFARKRRTWTGTASELLRTVTPQRPPAGWPKTPRGLAGRLRRAAPSLRKVGIDVTWERQSAARTVTLTFQPDPGRNPSSQSSEPSSVPVGQRRSSDGRNDRRPGHPSTVTPSAAEVPSPDQHRYPSDDDGDGHDGRMSQRTSAEEEGVSVAFTRSDGSLPTVALDSSSPLVDPQHCFYCGDSVEPTSASVEHGRTVCRPFSEAGR